MGKNEYENRVMGKSREEMLSQLSELSPGSLPYETVRLGLDELARADAERLALRRHFWTVAATIAGIVATAAAVTAAIVAVVQTT